MSQEPTQYNTTWTAAGVRQLKQKLEALKADPAEARSDYEALVLKTQNRYLDRIAARLEESLMQTLDPAHRYLPSMTPEDLHGIAQASQSGMVNKHINPMYSALLGRIGNPDRHLQKSPYCALLKRAEIMEKDGSIDLGDYIRAKPEIDRIFLGQRQAKGVKPADEILLFERHMLLESIDVANMHVAEAVLNEVHQDMRAAGMTASAYGTEFRRNDIRLLEAALNREVEQVDEPYFDAQLNYITNDMLSSVTEQLEGRSFLREGHCDLFAREACEQAMRMLTGKGHPPDKLDEVLAGYKKEFEDSPYVHFLEENVLYTHDEKGQVHFDNEIYARRKVELDQLFLDEAGPNPEAPSYIERFEEYLSILQVQATFNGIHDIINEQVNRIKGRGEEPGRQL